MVSYVGVLRMATSATHMSSVETKSYPDSATDGQNVRASVIREGHKNSTYYPGYRWILVRKGAVIETDRNR